MEGGFDFLFNTHARPVFLPQKLEFIGVIKRICVFQSRALTLIDKLKWQTAGSPTLRLQPLAAACCTEPFMR